ncbi:MAG: MarR family transcriptional regulator [Spirochaetaceae bacterium]|jgi:DNA-binding MarR family transcriptional regulator|nr:MarR family transcriptional regulator [Spirochaetaceae bacterium]
MNKDLPLAIGEKIKKVVSILYNEQKVARRYGIEFPLNHAEIHLLCIIGEHPEENTSQLAVRLNITKGAIAQNTKKLVGKGLMTSFHPPENKKKVYFELTKLGEKAVSGYYRHHKRLNDRLSEYWKTVSDKEMETIAAFLDALIDSSTLD